MRRLISFLRRGRLDRELSEEIQQHIERRTRALIADGMDPELARRTARRLFGNVTVVRETAHGIWGFPAFESMLADVLYGIRIFRRHPFVTAVAVLSIAAAVAASTGVFSLVNGALFRPLPGAHAGDIHRIFTSDSDGSLYGGTSYADYLTLSAERTLFATTCATTVVRANVRASGQPRSLPGQVADPACFDLLRMSPAAGRFYGREDTGGAPVVVSHSYSRREFGGDAAAIGQQLLIGGVGATIVGVAPRGFAGTSFDSGAEFWIPPALAASFMPEGVFRSRGHRGFTVYARLAPGVSLQQADASLAVVASRLRREDPRAWTDEANATRRLTMVEEVASRFISSPEGAGAVVGGATATIVTLVGVACINVAAMLLALGVTRTREISVRLALGASPRRVLRQLATESMLIGITGSAIGLFAVYVGNAILAARRPPDMPAIDLALDWRVAGVACALALLTPLLFGAAPARHALRLAVAEGVRRGQAPRRRVAARGREMLIVLQVATSCALLLVAALFARGLAEARSVAPGFSTRSIAVADVDLHHLDASPELLRLNMRRLLQAVETVPGVERATVATIVPLTGAAMELRGRAADSPAPASARGFYGNVVGPGYFEMLGITLRAGRGIDPQDSSSAPQVAVVNAALAEALWGSEHAVGRTILLEGGRPLAVVGVAANTAYRAAGEADVPILFLPFDQHPHGGAVVHARVRNDEPLGSMERALRSVNDRITVGALSTLDARLEQSRAPERAAQWVGAAAGAAQLGLALMGVWALVAYAVERRTVEMGVRLAFGATPRAIVMLVMRPSLALIVAGVVLGTAAGLILTSIVRSTAAGLAPLDIAWSVPVGAVLLAIAATSAWLPARRVALADPSVALRRE